MGPQGFWRSGENCFLFIFRELGSTGDYYQGFWEQAHSFGDFGSPVKSKKKSRLKGSAFISFDLKNKSSASGRKPSRPPFEKVNVFPFVLY